MDTLAKIAKKTGIVILWGVAAALLLYLLDIGCLIKTLFGIPCPGCGMTRAWLALLRGDFSAAFRWHPLFWLAPVLALLISGVLDRKYPKITQIAFILCFASLFLVYGLRMLALFPGESPMDYNAHSVLEKLLGLFRS